MNETIRLQHDEILRLREMVLDAYWAGIADADQSRRVQESTAKKLESVAATFQLKEEAWES